MLHVVKVIVVLLNVVAPAGQGQSLLLIQRPVLKKLTMTIAGNKLVQGMLNGEVSQNR
jgi:hypothetical protein